VQLGKYSVETRLGMITKCNSANFNDVDGIIGFGWADQNRSAAILKTLTQDGRPHWEIDRESPSLQQWPAPHFLLRSVLHDRTMTSRVVATRSTAPARELPRRYARWDAAAPARL
jgi:hypothetical protein